MIDISLRRLKDIKPEVLAEFVFNARRGSSLDIDGQSIAGLREDLTRKSQDVNEKMILAQRGHDLVGILGIYVGYPEMVFINRWHPILEESESWRDTALRMLNLCKSDLREWGSNRLEVVLSPIGEGMERERKRYQELYLAANFHLAAKELKMKVNLSRFRLLKKAPHLPEGMSLEGIDERGNDEIRGPFLRAFENGGSRLFLDMTPSQRRTTFGYWFSRKRPFQRASLLLVKDDRVIGGSMARYTKEGPNIGPVWISPEFRGLGLSNVLFHESIRRFQEDGIQMADLEVDVTNTAAIRLYTKYGFRDVYSQEYYSWQTDLNE